MNDEQLIVTDAWGAIARTASQRKFVPVLGFDVAASTDYADAKSADPRGISAPTGPSVQRLQERLIGQQLAAIEGLLQAKGGDSATVQYLAKLHDVWGVPGTPSDTLTPDPLLRFQASLVELAAILTKEWAASLSCDPAPLGVSWADYCTSIVENTLTTADLYEFLRASLDASHALLSGETLPGTLRFEDAFWMYVKLLKLTAEMIGDSPSFWEGSADTTFLQRHKHYISEEVARRGIDSGWEVAAGGRPVPRRREGAQPPCGTSLSHIIWLENLLRFTLLSRTRAYRTRADIAFSLSLDDQHVGIPRMPADPFEIGLLYNRIELREIDDLAAMTRYCSTDEQGGPRRPGEFHRALAKLLHHYSGSSDQRAPIALVLGIDLDMEHALEEYFDEYRVLLPVYLPLRRVGQAEYPENEDVWLEHSTPGWLLGSFTRRGVRFEITWEKVDIDTDLEHGGPLVIKLFGSPAHELPVISSLQGHTVKTLDPQAVPIHRLVLDEMELVSAVFGNTPDEIPGLANQLVDSMFFFFGHDALSWGDRIPYMMVNAMRGKRHAATDDGADVATWGSSEWEQPDASFDQTQSTPSVMAIARRGDKFVESVWKRLKVAPVGDGMGLGSITSKIVGEVAKW